MHACINIKDKFCTAIELQGTYRFSNIFIERIALIMLHFLCIIGTIYHHALSQCRKEKNWTNLKDNLLI